MAKVLRDYLKKGGNKAKEKCCILIIVTMMVTGKITKKMVMASITLEMEEYITVNGNKIKWTEWVFIIGQTVKYTLENTKMDRNMGMESLN